jgi:hypothetical protein
MHIAGEVVLEHVSLSSVQLECMSFGQKARKNIGKFAAWGIDKTRISNALRYKCPRSCKCCKQFQSKQLARICALFWHLPKIGQDAVLWTLTTAKMKERRFWSLDGVRVCRITENNQGPEIKLHIFGKLATKNSHDIRATKHNINLQSVRNQT